MKDFGLVYIKEISVKRKASSWANSTFRKDLDASEKCD